MVPAFLAFHDTALLRHCACLELSTKRG